MINPRSGSSVSILPELDELPKIQTSRALKASPPFRFIIFMGAGFIFPFMGSVGQVVGLVLEIGLILLLAAFIINNNQKSEKFFLYLGLLVGGEIFFRNFVHRNIPGYLIVQYALIGIGILSFPKILSHFRTKVTAPFVIWIIFCIYVSFTLFFSLDAYQGRWFLSIFLSGLVIIAISISYASMNHALRLLEGTALGVCLVFGVLLNFEIFHPTAERFGHGFNSAVQNAIFLTIGVICLIIITKKMHLKWYRYLIPIIALSLGALFTFSRGPLIGGLITIISVILSDYKFGTKLRNLITVVIVISILAAIVYNFAPDQFTSRYVGIKIDRERLGIWNGSIATWKEAPVFGWGIGSWSHIYPQFSWVNIEAPLYTSDAHNIIFQILVETGIIGTALFVLFLISILFKIMRTGSLELLGLFGYILAVGFVENWKISIFFVFVGYILVYNNYKKVRSI
jgi:O-antigen ligase